MDENPNISPGEAEVWAKNYMNSQAALHDPDQVAGGDPKGLAQGKYDSMMGLGNKRVNSSIGSRWRTRVTILEDGVSNQIKSRQMSEDQKKSTNMKSILKL